MKWQTMLDDLRATRIYNIEKRNHLLEKARFLTSRATKCREKVTVSIKGVINISTLRLFQRS